MPLERELCFRLPQGVPAMRLWRLVGAVSRRCTMTTLYFDTPSKVLREARVALRLRREGRHWVQTFKADAAGMSPLLGRHEWEFPAPGGRLHVAAFPLDDIRVLTGVDLAKHEAAFEQAFATRFVRQRCVIGLADGGHVEIVLDQGVIEAGRERLPIREVELELIDGEPGGLLALARVWLEPLALQLEVESKAERGHALASAAIGRPRKARHVPLDFSGTAPASAGVVAGSCLQQVASNVNGVLSSQEPECLHQLRVGLRRCRTALRVYHALAPSARTERAVARLHSLTPALGAARDADVLVDLLGVQRDAQLPGGIELAGLLAAARRERVSKRRGARAVVGSPAFQHFLLDVLDWMLRTSPGQANSADPSAPPQQTGRFARNVLRRLARRVERAGAHCHWQVAADRHAVRIRLKRLRYACEFFADVPGAGGMHGYLRHLEALQDLLGELNDIAVATQRLGEFALRGHGAPAGFVAGRLSVREEALCAALPGAWRAWAKRKRPF